ncbi:MAG: HD domain-containing protein [Erysipelotrichaceae bacterium]
MIKMQETKVMRDPVHGYIHVDLEVVWNVIACKEFQRLRRIHQLGGIYQVYHTAEHSRFAHSLGVYEIVRRMLHEVNGLADHLDDYEKMCVMLAGLLHDVGHGPFSHAFEAISQVKHEEYTKRIIVGESEINRVLRQYGENLPQDIASIINYTHPNRILNQLISGQLDADRMDYLLRDAYFTGTSYGNFDLERIIRTIRVKDDRLVLKESGIHSVEDYIMARYHMYWQVYYHPIARNYEALLQGIFQRMKELYQHQPERLAHLAMFHPFLEDQEADIQAHFRLDEHAAMYGFSLLQQGDDPILADLSDRLLNRRLLRYEDFESDARFEQLKQAVGQAGFDPIYYVKQDKLTQRPYKPYKSLDTHNIWILQENGEVVELSEVSQIVKAIAMGKIKEDRKVFYP